jgi:hypothetical protein
MGHELYRMIRDGALESWTVPMRMVAWAIADDAKDPSQGSPRDGGGPWSAIPVKGSWSADGEWQDGLTERTGLAERTIRRALALLGEAGYEMREQVAADSSGRAVFAFKGHAVRFRVPVLKPRQSPPDQGDLTTQSPPDQGDLTTRARQPKPTRSGRKAHPVRPQSPPSERGPISPGPPRVSPPPELQVVNSNLEGDRDRQGDDDSETPIPGLRTILDGLPGLDGDDALKAFIAARLTATTDDPAAWLLAKISEGPRAVGQFIGHSRRRLAQDRDRRQAEAEADAELRRQSDGLSQWMREHPEGTP